MRKSSEGVQAQVLLRPKERRFKEYWQRMNGWLFVVLICLTHWIWTNKLLVRPRNWDSSRPVEPSGLHLSRIKTRASALNWLGYALPLQLLLLWIFPFVRKVFYFFGFLDWLVLEMASFLYRYVGGLDFLPPSHFSLFTLHNLILAVSPNRENWATGEVLLTIWGTFSWQYRHKKDVPGGYSRGSPKLNLLYNSVVLTSCLA